MSYPGDLNDLPTKNVINRLNILIERRNTLLSKGLCPYCATNSKPHTCRYHDRMHEFHEYTERKY